MERNSLYIAGPYCFFENGYSKWWALRKEAESRGISVSMPTATELKYNSDCLQDNAREIFDDLLIRAVESDSLIANLENFRGSEPDGGTVFEMGMLYAMGARIYGHAASLQPIWKKTAYNYTLDEKGRMLDEKGFLYPYRELPFAPSIVASTHLCEGSFSSALDALIRDKREARMKGEAFCRKADEAAVPEEKTVFFSSFLRYSQDADQINESVRRRLQDKGYKVLFPVVKLDEDPYRNAYLCLEENLRRIEACSIFAADLNDFRSYEPSCDVAFESGFAFARKKKLSGFMADTRPMLERIPSFGPVDAQGNIIENFNFPINLMFSCSFDEIRKASADDFEAGSQVIV